MFKSSVSKAGAAPTSSFSESLRPLDHSLVPTAAKTHAPGVRRNQRSILLAAREQAGLEGREEGFQQGLADGIVQGSAEGRATAEAAARAELARELDSLKARFEVLMGQIDEAMAAWYGRAEREMELLTLQVAEKVLGHELKTSRDSLVQIAKEAIVEVTHATSARVRVNPFDCEAIVKYKDEILACASSIRRLEFVEDPTILGGCIIDTDGGLIDASFNGQLEAMAESLEDAA